MAGRYAVPLVERVAAPHFNGGGIQYVVETPTGVYYIIYVGTDSDLYFVKSLDSGVTWGHPTLIFTGTVTNVAVWYDRWSNISAGLIHLAYTESGGSDTLYRTINTESSDALSTQTTIFAGVSTATGSHIAIARARGGNVYCKTVIDAGAEGGFFRLPNANVPNGAWDAARTIDEAAATNDAMILCPGFAADNQDMLAIFWDTSANEISRKIYDDSANSWAETSIATSMTKVAATTNMFNFAATVDLANSRLIMVAWSAQDTANADLRCWTITESAITETSTNVVLNSTDDQGLCAIALNTVTGEWIVFYGGKSDGSETWGTEANVYFKTSKDAGATWGAETQLTSVSTVNGGAVGPVAPNLKSLICTPRFAFTWQASFYDAHTLFAYVRSITPLHLPRAASLAIGAA